jgi:hypothetical protein
MGKPLGFTGYTDGVSTANGPFQVLVEDVNGAVSKTPLAAVQNVVTITGTDALTAAEHGNRVCLLGEVGGNALVTLTLPAATGSGLMFKFIVSVVNTSNYVIQVPDASHTLEGVIMGCNDSADTVSGWESAAASDTITLNGSTQGGAAIGDYVELIDMGTNLWHVHGFVTQTGIEATPFSAAVGT